MSKERLKQFKNSLDFLDDSADMSDYHRLIDTLENLYKDGELYWVYRYAREQSGRVQELEQQQLTYRNVIEIAIHNMKGCSDLGTVFALNELERVLEDAEYHDYYGGDNE